ncbi:MAG: GNAT family N-acetyltransferase [Dokdonella sp.]|nr:GNAT family N-acetyltransferase [Dokdonella sp.]
MDSPELAAAELEWPLPACGSRTRLRSLRSDDLAAFQAYRNDAEVARYQGWQPMAEADAARFIRSMTAVRGAKLGAWIQLGIAARAGDTLIGDIGLFLADSGQQAEIGFSCSRAYQGQGLASEAVGLLLQLLSRHSDCRVVRAVVDARNERSIRLLERLEFARAGEHQADFRGEPCVELTYVRQLHPDPADTPVQDPVGASPR